jgi:hypothetical protein
MAPYVLHEAVGMELLLPRYSNSIAVLLLLSAEPPEGHQYSPPAPPVPVLP